MKYLFGLIPFLLLTACNDSDDSSNNESNLTVTDLATGAYIVSTGDVNEPTIGKYYAGEDGSRLLVLNDTTDEAKNLYRKTSEYDWVAVPNVTGNSTVTLLRYDAISNTSLDIANVVGSYVTQVAEGVIATFSISADGNLIAGSSNCQLSGTLNTSALPNALHLSLQAVSCADLPENSSGNLIIDTDYHPAAFRLITDDGNNVIDLWGYAD